MGRLGLGLALAVILILRTYPRVSATGTRCRGEAYAAKPQATRRSGGLASSRQTASCRGKAARGKAAYNLVKYYLAFAFKLFYYVLFDL